jgi:hypothetical protein
MVKASPRRSGSIATLNFAFQGSTVAVEAQSDDLNSEGNRPSFSPRSERLAE